MRSLDIVCCWGVEDKGRQGAEEGYLKGRKNWWDRLTGGALAGSRRTERRSDRSVLAANCD